MLLGYTFTYYIERLLRLITQIQLRYVVFAHTWQGGRYQLRRERNVEAIWHDILHRKPVTRFPKYYFPGHGNIALGKQYETSMFNSQVEGRWNQPEKRRRESHERLPVWIQGSINWYFWLSGRWCNLGEIAAGYENWFVVFNNVISWGASDFLKSVHIWCSIAYLAANPMILLCVFSRSVPISTRQWLL